MSRMRQPNQAPPPSRMPPPRSPAPRMPTPRMPDRPGLWRLMWKRQRRLVRPVLLLCGVAGLCVAGAAMVQKVSQGASLRERLGDATAPLGLRVQDVVIEGRQKTPEPLLRAAIGLNPGEPILGYSLTDARARIESIKWVQSATIERRLPGTIVVRLTERRPFAVWQLQGRFVLIDRNGETVTDSDVASFAGQVPLVVGPGAPPAAATLIDALAAYPVIVSHMQAAVRVGERRWNLRMNNGSDVLLPEGAEAAALARLMELQTNYQLLDRPLQVLDMRLADRLSVRPQPEKADSAGKDGARPNDPAHAPRKPT